MLCLVAALAGASVGFFIGVVVGSHLEKAAREQQARALGLAQFSQAFPAEGKRDL